MVPIPKLPSRLRRQIDFLSEIDKVKLVRRHTLLMDGSRRENDAEHGWHLAMMVLVFAALSPKRKLDVLKVLTMVLIHDIVEIDCGDAFLYDTKLRQRKKAQEKKAAIRIFGLLPPSQGRKFLRLWNEFEARKTPEARFAAAIDRFQPVLHNYATAGKVWRQENVGPSRVLAKNRHIGDGAPALWDAVRSMVNEGIKQGFFR